MRIHASFSFLLLLLCWLGGATSAQASHILGGDLAYQYAGTATAPNQYRVTARLYREYQTTAVDFGTVQLAVAKDGCDATAAGGFFTPLTRISTTTTSPLGCAGDFSYEIIVFEGVVQLPPGRWSLSINEENRTGSMRNVVESILRGFNVGAFLDNSSGLRNNSARFTSSTLPYLCASQSHRYSFTAFDADGDSLVYQSVQPLAKQLPDPLSSCGVPIPYMSYAAGSFQDPATGQMVAYPARTYSAAFPLFSFQVTNGVATPYFELSRTTGELLAFPIISQIGPYIVAVRVDEYRKLAGRPTLISSVVRDVIYSVFTGSGNRNPTVATARINNGTTDYPLNLPIDVATGETISLTLNATDPDAGQTVRLSSDVASIMPGASFQTTGPNQSRLTWQVPNLNPGLYSCSVTLADNGCPLNGTEVRTITFRVSRVVLATKTSQPTVLNAFPVPFHEQVQFRLASRTTQTVLISDGLGREVARLNSGLDGLVVWEPQATVPAGLYFARSADGRQVARLLRTDTP
ncbi:hypothetical protein [Hymenobacter lucidus]|uniref:T9SS type A sorting domain-containing protein n=1 Tax=Hymenobacter lucidus TaxID=2880930 RepID=A0ABS8ANH4_9BACT|nr:hypothetical protein [Hymenobacter lucidus]MCB2407336.1 hypothetical protein [Hymenobacter lucidus]